MSIIYTYPTVTPASGDLVLLTDTSDSSKATKNATVSDLLSVGLAQDINTVTKSLTTAQVQALHTTPIELIAAPGANKSLQILSVFGYIDFLSAAYPNAVTFNFRFTGATEFAYRSATTFTQAAADMRRIIPLTAPADWNTNTAFEVYTSGATGAGDSPVTFYVTYKLIDA